MRGSSGTGSPTRLTNPRDLVDLVGLESAFTGTLHPNNGEGWQNRMPVRSPRTRFGIAV
jgi:hypothetical protein